MSGIRELLYNINGRNLSIATLDQLLRDCCESYLQRF